MTAGTEHDRELDSDLVSIIMPTYNCGAFIAETIATVQAQTHPRWELIVVDDCSTDDTTDVVGPGQGRPADPVRTAGDQQRCRHGP